MRRLTILALAALAVAAPAHAESLEEALSATYASSSTLLAKRAELRAIDEAVPQALAGWRPSVTLSAGTGRARNFANDLSRYDSITSPSQGQLTVTQPLWQGGKTVAQTAQAEAQVEAGRAALAAAEQTVMTQAAIAYVDVTRDQELVALSVANQQTLRLQLASVQDRYDLGELTTTDVHQAEARLAQSEADRAAAEAALEASRASYQAVVGHAPGRLDTPAIPSISSNIDEARAAALASSPEIAAADWAVRAAEHGVEVAKADLMPSVTLQAGLNRSLNSGVPNYATRTDQIMLNVSIPLYDGGGTWSRVRGQTQTMGQRHAEADQARREISQAASQAWLSLVAARLKVRAYSAQVAAATAARDGVDVEAKVGSRSALDVLNADQELFNAKASAAGAQHDELAASFRLRQAEGEMTADALGLAVDRYDPTHHLDEVRGRWIGP